MRIKLSKGKQNELILLAKNKLTWKELASKLNCSEQYLKRDLKYENITLSNEVYAELCLLSKINFDKFIENKLDDNWGSSKGGLNSTGSTIKLIPPKKDEKLAEFIGAVLGDGNITFYQKGKKIGVYSIRIAGDLEKDSRYHKYLKSLGEKLFNIKGKEILRPKNNERFLAFNSKKLVEFFISMGLKPGDKIKNQTTIPSWIFNDSKCIRSCIRGLIDTDGSFHRMSNKDPNLLRIDFANHNLRLLEDTRNLFIKLDFNPSKLIQNRHFNLSRKEEIKKYLNEIGSSNKKHLDRINKLYSPIV